MQFSYFVLWRWCNSFSKPFGRTSSKHFLFFSKLDNIYVFYPQNEKKFFCPRRQLQHCSFAYCRNLGSWFDSRLSMAIHKVMTKNRWLFIFLFVEHTVYLEISLSKFSWLSSRLYTTATGFLVSKKKTMVLRRWESENKNLVLFNVKGWIVTVKG